MRTRLVFILGKSLAQLIEMIEQSIKIYDRYSFMSIELLEYLKKKIV